MMNSVQGLRFKVQSLRFKVQSLKFKVSSLKFFTLHSSFFILHFSFFILLLSCRRYNTQQPTQGSTGFERQKQEILMRVNQQLVEEDAQEIEAYAARKGWQLTTTESGLWYMIYKNGQGQKATTGKIATLEYTLSLIDSTVCYSSEQLGRKEFRLGQGGVESGLEEGVLLMRIGDKARMIMPPHLAHGLTGDGFCIPRRAIIQYDVELVDLRL